MEPAGMMDRNTAVWTTFLPMVPACLIIITFNLQRERKKTGPNFQLSLKKKAQEMIFNLFFFFQNICIYISTFIKFGLEKKAPLSKWIPNITNHLVVIAEDMTKMS
ncbi:hypothetical protein SNE40_015309 [Patella caerulea]|uniref:Uncharacterized protein n=1 Tax=Patella caerulea TaxID=87958 RepID=A0AAN8PJ00_PATCE